MRIHQIGAALAIAVFVSAAPAFLHSDGCAQTAAGRTEGTDFKYTGTKRCAECHASKVTGNQMVLWKQSAHARAYAVLRGDEARQIAARRGIQTPPQETASCLACHRTGAGEAPGRFGDDFDVAEGVTCEACHGPGSEYSKTEHMLKYEKALAAGLQSPDAKTCLGCHNADSPTFKGFDYKSAMQKIAHPLGPF